jgi:twinkle protein
MITIFKNFQEVDKPFIIPMEGAIKRIREGNSRSIVEMIRLHPEASDSLKKKLPCVLFSGEFTKRNSKSLTKHSGYMVLDFDEVKDPIEYRESLKEYPFIYAAWISPSGTGVKALCKIKYTERHRDHFSYLLNNVFQDLDRSGINVDRICFESYDPEVWVNENCTEMDGLQDSRPPEYTQRVNANLDERKIYANLKKWTERRGELFVEGNRNSFVMKMAAAMNRTGVSEDSCMQFLYDDYVHNASGFTKHELEYTVSRVYKSYAHQHGTMAFQRDDIVTDDGEVMNDQAFDADVEVSDVIYLADAYDGLVSLRNNTTSYGETTYFNNLDKHFRWMRTELTILHGYGNIGKSTFASQLAMLKSINEGTKWCVFSPENYPVEHFYKDLMQMYTGKSINKTHTNPMSDLEFENASEFVGKHFFNIYPKDDSPTPDLILKRFAEMIIKHKIDGVMIDPFNQLDNDWSRSGRDDKYLDKVLSRFKRFAQNYNIYFVICAHPTKPAKNKSGGYDTPTYYDLAGGAMWANKADNILCYHRPNFFVDPRDNLCEVSSQKIKKQPMNGILGTCSLEYSRESFRFYEEGVSPFKKQTNADEFIEPYRESDEDPF